MTGENCKRPKAPCGAISQFECYSLAEFRRRTGIGAKLLRKCREQGLVIREAGHRRFILGGDWLAFLAKK